MSNIQRVPVSAHRRSIVSCIPQETFQKLLDLHQQPAQDVRLRKTLLARSN